MCHESFIPDSPPLPLIAQIIILIDFDYFRTDPGVRPDAKGRR